MMPADGFHHTLCKEKRKELTSAHDVQAVNFAGMTFPLN
jgi:hypothetical protein